MKGFPHRLRVRVRNEVMARQRGLKGRSVCRAVIGTERCCCGRDNCGEAPRPRQCWEGIGLMRFLFRGTCEAHEGWGQR